MIDLSIIIVNWNTRDLLAQCLQSVYETVQGLEFEVFVVDNASTDGSPMMVKKEFPQVKLIENKKNVGFAIANNQAIRESTGQYVVLLNSDTVIINNALDRLFLFLETHPEAGIVGSKLVDGSGSVQIHDPHFPTLFSEFCMMTHLDRVLLRHRDISRDPDRLRSVDWLTGACLMARKKDIQEVGLLDESFFMYAEELDWCWRFKRAGWKIYYVPQAQVIHLGGSSTKLVAEKMFLQLYKSRVAFFRKHYGNQTARVLKGVLILGSLLRLAAGPIAYVLKPNLRTDIAYKYRCYAHLLGAVYAF